MQIEIYSALLHPSCHWYVTPALQGKPIPYLIFISLNSYEMVSILVKTLHFSQRVTSILLCESNQCMDSCECSPLLKIVGNFFQVKVKHPLFCL